MSEGETRPLPCRVKTPEENENEQSRIRSETRRGKDGFENHAGEKGECPTGGVLPPPLEPSLLGDAAAETETDSFLLSLGMKEERVGRVRRKCPKLEKMVSPKGMAQVVRFLKDEIGIPGKKLHLVIEKCPKLLVYDVREKLLPSAMCLLGTGVSKTQLRTMVAKFPEVLTRSVEEKLCPLLSFLSFLGVAESKLPHILCSYPRVVSFSVEDKFCSTLAFLLNEGVRKEDVAKGVVRFPQLLASGLESKIKPAVRYLQSIGFQEKHLCRTVSKHPSLLSRDPQKSFQPCVDFLVRNGFSKGQVLAMATTYPPLLTQNVPRVLRLKLEYLRDTMRMPLQDAVDFPRYFGFSLAKKIIPMHSKLGLEQAAPLHGLKSMFRDSKNINKREKETKKIRKMQRSC